MTFFLYGLLAMICFSYSDNRKEKMCFLITCLFFIIPPLIRILVQPELMCLFGVGVEVFFYFYAGIELLYLFVILPFIPRYSTGVTILFLSMIACGLNLYEGINFYVPTSTYQYYPLINQVVMDATLFSILAKPSMRFIALYLTIYLGYFYSWPFYQFLLT